eukprot:749359-Hanusia_phi.AAC.9
MTKRGRNHDQNQRLLIGDWRQVRNDRPSKRFAAQKKKSAELSETVKEKKEVPKEQASSLVVLLEEDPKDVFHEELNDATQRPGPIPPAVESQACEPKTDPADPPAELAPAERELPKNEATLTASPKKNRALAMAEHARQQLQELPDKVEDQSSGAFQAARSGAVMTWRL